MTSKIFLGLWSKYRRGSEASSVADYLTSCHFGMARKYRRHFTGREFIVLAGGEPLEKEDAMKEFLNLPFGNCTITAIQLLASDKFEQNLYGTFVALEPSIQGACV